MNVHVLVNIHCLKKEINKDIVHLSSFVHPSMLPIQLYLLIYISTSYYSYGYTYKAEAVKKLLESYSLNVSFLNVTTDDGYILTMLNVDPMKMQKKCMIFQHGFLDNAAGISLNYPNISLIVSAVRAGIRVFLGNNRGNGISMAHTQYPTDSKAFWNFTKDQFAIYDLPAQVGAAASLCRGPVFYVGHSQGTTQLLSGLSYAPQVAENISGVALLAAVATIEHMRVWWLQALAHMDVDTLMEYFDQRDFNLVPALHRLFGHLCHTVPSLCNDVMNGFGGPSTHIPNSLYPKIVAFLPAPTSIRDIVDWGQAVRTGKFQRYDWGSPERNMAAYGQPTPPLWPLERFPGAHQSPVPALPRLELFFGGQDYLADPTDAARLVSRLKSLGVPFNLTVTQDYSHLDYLWADNALEVVYRPVIQAILSS